VIRKFLLADDDQDDAELFIEALRNIDPSMVLYPAQNGKEALKTLQAQKADPDIIFLDVNMPEMDGWDCLANLKKDSHLKHIPVVMYSTSPTSLNGKRAIQEGAVCFLEKPPSYLLLKSFLSELSKASKTNLLETLRTIESSRSFKLHVA
jgi:CheY-like chemotaxis protein